MAASSSKPTGVHFALVIFVMATLILSLSCYLLAKEYYTAKNAERDANQKATTAAADLKKAIDEKHLIQQRTGYEIITVGGLEDTGNQSMLGQINDDLRKNGGEQVQPNAQAPTVRATLPALRSLINNNNVLIAQLQQNVRNLTLELEAERSKHQGALSTAQKSQSDSELALQQKVASVNENTNSLKAETEKWVKEYRTELRNKETIQDQYDRYRKDMEIEMNVMRDTVRDLQRRVYQVENASFDNADGKIVRVDNTTRTVWINLGSGDNLRNQVSFSVYMKNHQGVGRGKEDIKAKIEVTEIRDAHLAQARIVQEDFTRPIQVDDPIYSPVWERGMREHFSFVGIQDLDGDGKNDFELLRNILENAGAGVEVFVDQNGQRNPPDAHLTPKTKFLVVGTLEDPTNFPSVDTEKQDQIKRVAEQAKLLDEEALSRGIKTVNIRDFLNYMGYQTQQRLFVPGEKGTFQLRAGAQSTGVNEGLGNDRFSEGVTSERFSKENLKRFGDGSQNNK